MKPFVYYREERNANGELIDKEYNGINQFSAGRFGKPLYTAEQIEAAVLAERVRMCKQFNIPMELANETATDNEAN